MKVALVYDWLDSKVGGAEVVLKALQTAFPDAPLYVAYVTKNAPQWVKQLDLRTSWMQKWQWWWQWKFLTPIFLPRAFESFNFDDYEIVISVSSFAAKGILTKPDQIHLDYDLTPPRWLYSHQNDYLTGLRKRIFNHQIKKIERVDKIIAQRPDKMVAISQLVADRIKETYNREVEEIIYPPVEIEKWQKKRNNFFMNDNKKIKNKNVDLPDIFDLVVARHVAYKKINIAIEAAIETNSPLVIVGSGPETKRLKKLAQKLAQKRVFLIEKQKNFLSKKENIQPLIYFLGIINDQELAYLYKTARSLIMVGEEDFGITALEAKYCGLPVVINRNSGVAELLTHQKNAYFLPTDEKKDLIKALNYLQNNFFFREKLIVQNQQNKLQYTTDDFKAHFQKLTEQLYRQLMKEKI